ncbi:hypothetical protein KKA14_21225, partial [bacterium]|nr:hypothetical protein [bacterium]
MVRKIARVPIALLLVAGLIACSSYKLESGKYVMTVKLPKTEKISARNVEIIVNEDKVTIQNPNQEKTLTGLIKENNISFQGENESEKVEFVGVLTGNNQVKGTVVQKSDKETTFSAEFTIAKEQEKK